MRYGIDAFCDYLQHTGAAPQLSVAGDTTDERIEWVIDSGMGVIGTYGEAIEKIEALWEQSNGGFGCYLNFDHNWAPFAAKKHNYHLLANYVLPHFKGTHRRLQQSEAVSRDTREELAAKAWDAITSYTEKHTKAGAGAEE